MLISKAATIVVSMLPVVAGGSCINASNTAASDGGHVVMNVSGYEIMVPDDATDADKHSAQYLYNQLKDRLIDNNGVANKADENANALKIEVSINDEYSDEYAIIGENGKIRLTARSEETMQWLSGQLIKNLAIADTSINANDLPPAIIDISNNSKTSGNFAFEYREAYLPENISRQQSAIFGENNVAYDWGLWGHNIHKIVAEKADDSVYAIVSKEKNTDQYCFSSELLYELVHDYIIDNFGDGSTKSSRFVIMPNDNHEACGCEECVKAGNDGGNATPAVAAFVKKLAGEFPGHIFLMGAYGSTITPPADVMPQNVGVLISAMQWPLSVSTGGRRLADFDSSVKRWVEKCRYGIYVWDYINNFDDYFTPFPILHIMQRRLQHYEELGVKGVFLNGSGDVYSSFSGLHNFVLAALMINPHYDVEDLVRKYFRQYYPASGEMLAGYYMQWEGAVMKNKKRLNIYAPVGQALDYLGRDEFGKFYEALCDAAEVAEGEERHRIDLLKSGLAYTMLEVSRALGTGSGGCITGQAKVRGDVKTWLQTLKNLPGSVNIISESGLRLSDYIKSWELSILGYEPYNMLAGRELKALTELDGGYGDLSVLTDCVNGLPCGYHYGWLISSLGDRLEIEIPVLPGAGQLEVSFLKLTRHRIAFPTKIEVIMEGNVIASQSADDAAEADVIKEDSRRLVYNFDISRAVATTKSGSMVLRMTRPKGRNSHLAIDEIRLKR